MVGQMAEMKVARKVVWLVEKKVETKVETKVDEMDVYSAVRWVKMSAGRRVATKVSMKVV